MFSGHYNNPSGFCFDIACTDEPINDNPKLQGYNVDEKVKLYQENSCFNIKNYIDNYINEIHLSINELSENQTNIDVVENINFTSFIDYLIISELSKNVDGYRLSTFC